MTGDRPWPQVPIGNANHADAAVVIVGGGLSGMCVAIDLLKRNKCRNFIILEKSAGVGVPFDSEVHTGRSWAPFPSLTAGEGTWYDQRYPGCACDVGSILYSYSFAKNPDWTREYPGQEEILQYLTQVAQDYKLYSHFRFNSAVRSARWDDQEKKWVVSVKTAPGTKEAEYSTEYEIRADFLVSGVGQLNVPNWPEIPGIDSFDGKKMHSARWDWSYDLKDKKIALLGNGCTAVQILPEIAKVAKHVTVFQRTPNWVIPRLDAAVSPFRRAIYRYVPGVMSRKRAAHMDFRESTHAFVNNPSGDMASLFADANRQMMETQLPNRPEMWKKLTPAYTIGCKRIIISDDYYPALGQDNVDLETRPINSIQGSQLKVHNPDSSLSDTMDGGFDLLVCATGFQTTQFLHSIEVTGLNNQTLSDIWKNGARALYGMTVESLPNFAMLYGPNTNLGHNSIILMIESQSRYINGLIKPVLEARSQGRALALHPKKAVMDEFNDTIQKELRDSAFNDPNCNSWYKNEAGIITNNWSRTVVEYQQMVENVRYDEFEAEGSGKDVLEGRKKLHVGRVKEESVLSDRTLAIVGAVSSAALVGGWLLRNSRYLQGIRVR